MKLRLLLLSLFVASVTYGQGPKPGSNEDPIRQSLFAAHPVRELLATVQTTGAPGPLLTIIEASKLADAGKKTEALAGYRRALDDKTIGTQLTLWAWNGLRELGQSPDPKIAREVLGVVLEVPVKNGYDTLAGYNDGTARYINNGGKGVFWDVPDAIIKKQLQALIDAAARDAIKPQPRKTLALPKTGAQVTLLTRSGPYVITQPSAAVIMSGNALAAELLTRNQAQMSQPNK
jgi:hypothetical protein